MHIIRVVLPIDFMKYKILITIFVATIFTFPFYRFEFSIEISLLLKILKGVIFSSIIFFLIKKEKFVNVNLLSYKLDCKIKTLIPAIILFVVYFILLLNNNDFLSIITFNNVVFLALLVTFLGAFIEELLFRGYIQNLLINNQFSVLKSILISSLIFSLFHITNIFRNNDIWSVFNQTILAFIMGILFGSLFIFTKNIMIITVIHFLINVPASLSKYIKNSNILNESELINVSFIENLMGSIFLFLIFSPLIFTAVYYLKLVTKNEKNVKAQNI